MICTKEEMIQRVMDCGYELINKAESIVSDFKYGTDLTITCYLEWCDDGDGLRINVEQEFIPERCIKRLQECNHG
jgi:hypothetical protein